jgi:hypothetical protein
MRSKLSTFADFANSLFPHEADFLLSVQQFSKPDNLKIINLISYNSKNPLNRLPFDSSIDKRSYSYVKNWITETLSKADVDLFYDWLLSIERSVMSDSITPDQERELMSYASTIKPSHYNFIKFYQVMQHYRDYLMVRNRIRYYAQVTKYLEEFYRNYIKVADLNNEMNIAAERIVNQINANDQEFQRWELLLKNIYFDESLDGYTRYRAAVRLTILFYTNREFNRLLSIYDHLDIQFRKDVFYSKRILANYYHNRAMMHSKLNELDLAEKYGFLSIRQKNSDYLFYLVSLCGVLLSKGKSEKALRMMTDSIVELKNTNSFHSKIGFASFYIKALSANNHNEKAVSYGSTFFEGYKKEIFDYRWHLFFSSYMKVLLRTEKYAKIISLSRRYKLISKEKEYMGKAMYIPVILWYTTLSEYMEGIITQERFTEIIVKSGKSLLVNSYKVQKICELLSDLAFCLPDEVKDIAHKLEVSF